MFRKRETTERVRRGGLAFVTSIFLTLSVALPTVAHTPTDHWTCYTGGAPAPGLCYYHLANADATYHYLDEVPASARDAIHRGTHTVMDDHPLQLTEVAGSNNHIQWDTLCQVACMLERSVDSGAQHIVTFDLHFDPGAGPASGWNRNTSLGHGTFTTLDLWSVAAHEWGQAVGMGHSETGFGHDCASGSTVNTSWATMSQGNCLVGGHTEQRTLTSDDFLGRCQIYSHAHGYACSGD